MNDCPPRSDAPSILQLGKAIYKKWSDDHASRLAAAFSYYAIFSIGPLLFIAITLLGVIYGKKAASDQLRPQISSLVGDQSAQFIQGLIAKAAVHPGLSFAGILSIVLIFYAATNLFVSLQDSLNVIFGVEPKADRGVMGVIKDRALSFVMVLLVGVFIIASIVLSGLTKYLLAGDAAATSLLLQSANFAVSAAVFTAVFAMLFKYLPDVQIDWRDTLIGAAVTAILFTVARIGLSFYFSHSTVANPFGAAGSFVIILLFVYYSSQIFFLGAEFTQVWACREGKPVRPSANAQRLHEQEPKKTKSAPPRPPAAAAAPGHWERAMGPKGGHGGWNWVARDESAARQGAASRGRRAAPQARVGVWPATAVVLSVAWFYFRRPLKTPKAGA